MLTIGVEETGHSNNVYLAYPTISSTVGKGMPLKHRSMSIVHDEFFDVDFARVVGSSCLRHQKMGAGDFLRASCSFVVPWSAQRFAKGMATSRATISTSSIVRCETNDSPDPLRLTKVEEHGLRHLSPVEKHPCSSCNAPTGPCPQHLIFNHGCKCKRTV